MCITSSFVYLYSRLLEMGCFKCSNGSLGKITSDQESLSCILELAHLMPLTLALLATKEYLNYTYI